MSLTQKNSFGGQSGNAVIIVLVALVVVALGALAYLSGQTGGDEAKPAAEQVAAATTDAPTAEAQNPADAAVPDQPPAESAEAAPVSEGDIKPGNPVVARVDGKDITRLDVFNLVQTLPPQTRQMPLEKLFPMAVDQLISAKVIEKKTEGVDLSADEEVKKQLELAREQIERSVYIQKEVSKKVTDDRLKAAYEDYKKNFPEVKEVKASHILVKEEAKAAEIIEKLNEGGDFAALAKENSIDGTAKNGGDLGYFVKQDVVPAFGDAAFKLDVGKFSEKPVKSDFGYHIIKVEDKRNRPVPEFAEAKPFLEAQVRRQVLEELIGGWRDAAKVERFDINGAPLKEKSGG